MDRVITAAFNLCENKLNFIISMWTHFFDLFISKIHNYDQLLEKSDSIQCCDTDGVWVVCAVHMTNTKSYIFRDAFVVIQLIWDIFRLFFNSVRIVVVANLIESAIFALPPTENCSQNDNK